MVAATLSSVPHRMGQAIVLHGFFEGTKSFGEELVDFRTSIHCSRQLPIRMNELDNAGLDLERAGTRAIHLCHTHFPCVMSICLMGCVLVAFLEGIDLPREHSLGPVHGVCITRESCLEGETILLLVLMHVQPRAFFDVRTQSPSPFATVVALNHVSRFILEEDTKKTMTSFHFHERSFGNPNVRLSTQAFPVGNNLIGKLLLFSLEGVGDFFDAILVNSTAGMFKSCNIRASFDATELFIGIL